MTANTEQERSVPIKMQPGDDLHLTMLMAPHGLNFVTGKDREQLLAWGVTCGKQPAALQQCQHANRLSSIYTSNVLLLCRVKSLKPHVLRDSLKEVSNPRK